MVEGQDEAGMQSACMQRAAWLTWSGLGASPVDRSVIGSAPDDVFSSDPGPGRHTQIYYSCAVWSSLEFVVLLAALNQPRILLLNLQSSM